MWRIFDTLVLKVCVDAGEDTDKFLVLDSSDNVDYRTGAELLSDIGAAGALNLTPNYIPKADTATTLGDSVFYQSPASTYIGLNETAPDRTLHVNLEDGTTNDTTFLLRVTHQTSGTAAAGIGAGIEFETEDQYSSLNVVATIEGVDESPGSGDSQGECVIKTYDEAGSGLAERWRWLYDGTARMQTCVDAGADTDKFLVWDSNKNIDYRTGSEVLSDIGGAPALSLTINYIPKAASATTLGDSPFYFNGNNLGVGTNYIGYDGTSSKGLFFDSSNMASIRNTPAIYTDLRVSASLIDDTSYAQGVGAGIVFFGKYNSGGDIAAFASVKGYKANGTDGNTSGQLHLLTGASAKAIIDESGNLAVSTTSPAGRFDVSYSGVSGVPTIALGADASATTRTDTTAKYSRIGAVHYTNAEEPFCVIYTEAVVDENSIFVGGGTNYLNAAMYIRFYTAADTTTVSGSERARIAPDGGFYMYALKSGATQAAAGAASGELWTTSSHASLPDHVVMMGV